MPIHHREDEAWYVIDGSLTFYVADQVIEADAGSFVFAQRGIPQTFTVDTEPSRVLVFASPSGFEQFAVELGVPGLAGQMPSHLAMPSPEVFVQSPNATV
jgi:quercetin dioxygenase-like cupin family protein